MADCNLETSKSKYCAGSWDLECITVGSAHPDEISFVNKKTKQKIPVIDVEFVWEITDELDNPVHTLTIGSGLTIIPSNKLQFLLGTPVTDTAGIYKHTLFWIQPSTGANFPILKGTITVDP